MLTAKGLATVALIRVRDGWADLTPSQQAECADLAERLAVALRAAKPASPSHARVPLIGRIVA